MTAFIPALLGLAVCASAFAWLLVRGGDLEPPKPEERDADSVRWAP